MALSTRRLCVLMLVLLAVAATFCHGHGAVLQETTIIYRRAGPLMAGDNVLLDRTSRGGDAYHGSGFTHVPHGYHGSKMSFGVNVGDYSAGVRGSVWNVGAVVVAPVLAAAWFA